jgi:hypothetical protein
MPRNDAQGLFWHDEPKVKAAKKEKIKREPPFPFWLEKNYLPGLAEALRFDVQQFTDAELVIAQAKGERLVWDIECYPNYFLVAFKSIDSGKIVYFEADGDMLCLDIPKLKWVMEKFCLISFNGLHYDAPIAALALAGRQPDELHFATEAIIVRQERPHEVLKAFKVKPLELNHIDVKEVAPLHDSLKMYAARLHTRRLQDLPFKPGTILSEQQIPIVRYYCVNDLRCTEELYNFLKKEIELREKMTSEYNVDLRSKSDAQVAEAVILSGLRKLTKERFKKPEIEVGRTFRYVVPSYIKYKTPLLNSVLDAVKAKDFVIDFDGSVRKEGALKLQFAIADGYYTMGIGGLHSTEKKVTHHAGDEWLLIDRDVASFYPRVILTQNLFPKHLGPAFIRVYNSIVERRLAAKDQAANLKKMYKGKEMPLHVQEKIDDLNTIADSLKITINGSFGKFGNGYSMLYSPNLMIQVTLTGQLVLLMLIERLELAGINVVSANTDGIVIKCHKSMKDTLDAIVHQWETDIDCKTEETFYKTLCSRDVNSYIAVKDDGEIKVKGAYSERGSAGNSPLSKNPYILIASDAVKEYITKGTPVDHTIRNCKDIKRFLCVRYVKGNPQGVGGAVKLYGQEGVQDEYLGKAIRWYYSTNVDGEIVYGINGNKVPKTEGARPIMELPEEMPEDINYDWYVEKANKIIEEIGYCPA